MIADYDFPFVYSESTVDITNEPEVSCNLTVFYLWIKYISFKLSLHKKIEYMYLYTITDIFLPMIYLGLGTWLIKHHKPFCKHAKKLL